jgi:hypothetical protein
MAVRPTTVTLSKESTRYADWLKVFGGATVEVTAALPHVAQVRGETKEVFLLNLKALDDSQRRRLVEHLSERFGESCEDIERELDERGLPILTDDTTWSIDMRYLT